MVRVLTIVLVLLAPARALAFPKCPSTEWQLVGLSKSGRFGVLVSTESLGGGEVWVLDLTNESPIIILSAKNDLDVVQGAVPLDFGPLAVSRREEWQGKAGETAELARHLVAKGCHGLRPEEQHALDLYDQRSGTLGAAWLGNGWATLLYELPDADGCDQSTGEGAIAVACGASTTIEDQILGEHDFVRFGEAVATRVYRGTNDPALALSLLWRGPKPKDDLETIARLSDQMVYLVHPGRGNDGIAFGREEDQNADHVPTSPSRHVE